MTINASLTKLWSAILKSHSRATVANAIEKAQVFIGASAIVRLIHEIAKLVSSRSEHVNADMDAQYIDTIAEH